MSIRYRNILGAVVLVGASTLITSQVVSRQNDDQQVQEMYEAWMKYAEPGEQHAHLAKFAGSWSQVNTHWPYPGAEPMQSTSEATYRPILGGRFMMEHTNGVMEMEGEKFPFEGLCILGYDNFKQKHTFMWADSMGTLMMIGEGTADPTGKIITYKSEMPNPMTGGMTPIKCVSTIMSNDKTMFEMFEKRGETWHRSMEIIGKRTAGLTSVEHEGRRLDRANAEQDGYDRD